MFLNFIYLFLSVVVFAGGGGGGGVCIFVVVFLGRRVVLFRVPAGTPAGGPKANASAL